MGRGGDLYRAEEDEEGLLPQRPTRDTRGQGLGPKSYTKSVTTTGTTSPRFFVTDNSPPTLSPVPSVTVG